MEAITFLLRRMAAALFALYAAASLAQPNAIVLVAKPGLLDPNFRETVVLVTRTVDAQMVGVILNRPTDIRLAELWSDGGSTESYKDRVFFGGPVMRRTIIALYRAAAPLPAPAFPLFGNVYLSMHPGNIAPLLGGAGETYRLFAGFSGWAPRQLENEIAAGGWFVLPAREEWLFRADPSSLWRELVDQATNSRAARGRLLAILEP